MKSNPTLLVIASVIVAAGTYGYFLTGNSGESAQLPITVTATENQAQTRFQMLVSGLPTSFDTSIFSDERFNSLVNLSTPISPESASRSDPFAPISGK